MNWVESKKLQILETQVNFGEREFTLLNAYPNKITILLSFQGNANTQNERKEFLSPEMKRCVYARKTGF